MALPVPTPPGLGGDITAVVVKAANAISATGNALVDSVPGVDQLGDITDTIRAVRAWSSNRHNWVRVAWFAAGSVMFAVGAVMLGERPVGNAVATVTKPVGNVVKTVKG